MHGGDVAEMGAAERDRRREGAGISSVDREWFKELERENRELKRANEILRKAAPLIAPAPNHNRRQSTHWHFQTIEGDHCRVSTRLGGGECRATTDDAHDACRRSCWNRRASRCGPARGT